jgi:hypothetical protein
MEQSAHYNPILGEFLQLEAELTKNEVTPDTSDEMPEKCVLGSSMIVMRCPQSFLKYRRPAVVIAHAPLS